MIFRKKTAGRDIFGYFLLGVSVLMLAKSVTLCFSTDIWYDELFTVGMAEHSYGELIRFTAADVHPPLYYCIVKFVVELCKLIAPSVGTVIPAKLVSVLPYFGLLAYSVIFVRRRFGMFTAGLFFFCVTAMPQLPAYTVEVRMYGWALLFVTAAFLHAYGCLTAGAGSGIPGLAETSGETGRGKDPGCWRYFHGAALALYSLAAAYTQYFAAVAAGMVYLWLLLIFLWRDRSRLREWSCYAAAAVVGYVPWLFALTGQISAVRENYWILPLTWRSLGGCVKFLMKPAFANEILATVLAVVLFAGYVSVFAICVLQKKLEHDDRVFGKESEKSIFLFVVGGIGVLAGVVGFGFAASLLLRPVFVYRYMIPALGCFWLSFAVCLEGVLGKQNGDLQTHAGVADRIIRTGGILLTILVVIVGLRDYRAFMGEEEYKHVCMEETRTALSLIGSEDTVLYNFDQVQAVTGYYLPETTARFLWRVEGEKLIQEITSPCGYAEDVEEIRRLAHEAGNAKNLWFIGSFNSRDGIVEEWRQAGLTVEEQGSFLLERYWFNLYKISLSDHTTL